MAATSSSPAIATSSTTAAKLESPLVQAILKDPLRYALFVLLASILLVVIYATLIGGKSDPPYLQLQVSTKLTTRRAATLSSAQIRGDAPLTVGGMRPTTIRDVRLSLRHDIDALHVAGMCAMHYDFGVSACMMRRLGAESYVMMYNLNVTGWRAHKLINWETSTLCEEGKQKYQVERFEAVWVRYIAQDGFAYDRFFDDPEARGAQHLAYLNKGILPCHKMSIEELARALREAATMIDVSATDAL